MQKGQEQEITIKEFFTLCQEEKGTYQIETPDGWQDIGRLVQKQNKECYNLVLENGQELGCSFDHYIWTTNDINNPTTYKWKKSKDIDTQSDFVLVRLGNEANDTGWQKVVAKKYIGVRDTFDFEVKSPNHRYYSNNIVSHNTGKSMTCDALSDYWQMPLLRLDMGSIFSPHIGESEANMRQVIQTSEAIAPCVTGDTKILLTNGKEERIEDLFNGDQQSLSVWSINKSTLQKEITPVQAITRRVVQSVVKINTATGSITTSSDHKMLIIKNGILHEISAKDISNGEYIASFQSLPCQSQHPYIDDIIPQETRLYSKYLFDRTRIKGSVRSCRKYKKSFYIKNLELNKPLTYNDSLTLDRYEFGLSGFHRSFLRIKLVDINSRACLPTDFFYILGLLDSDGSFEGKRSRISFVNTCYALHSKFKNILSKYFEIYPSTIMKEESEKKQFLPGESANPYYKACYTTYFSNRLLQQMLCSVKLNLHTYHTKYLCSYLKGYFDGDGCITFDTRNQGRVYFCTYSKAQRDLLRHILRLLGFITYDNSISDNRFSSYICITSRCQIQRFIDLIYTEHPDKEHTILENFESSKQTDSGRYYGLPVGSLLKQSNIKTNSVPGIYSSTMSRISHGISIVHDDQRELLLSASSKGTELNKLLKSDVIGIKVLSVTHIKKRTQVFDLSCVKNHNFVANGLLSRNCILWIDEIEKGIGGVASSNQTDGGVGSRIFGTLLTWLQEKTTPVFVICTANNVHSIPPEFMRAGRFDEIFFLDLPNKNQREDILNRLITKKHRNPQKFDIPMIAVASSNYSPAELEKAIGNALFIAYAEDKRPLTTKDIIVEIGKFQPLYNSRREEIQDMKEWALGEDGSGGRAVLANSSSLQGSGDYSIKSTSRHISFSEEDI